RSFIDGVLLEPASSAPPEPPSRSAAGTDGADCDGGADDSTGRCSMSLSRGASGARGSVSRGGRAGLASLSLFGGPSGSVAAPASASSRYGLSTASPVCRVDGRRPRPRRGGRRLSVMQWGCKKVIHVRPPAVIAGPASSSVEASCPYGLRARNARRAGQTLLGNRSPALAWRAKQSMYDGN